VASVISRVDGVADRFAITFDDGPSPRWTPRVLDLLAAAGACATFFPLAPNIRRHTALVRRAFDVGHEIGVHGEWHLPPAWLPWRLLAREIDHGLVAAVAATGQRPAIYRPAFDLLRRDQAARIRTLGLTPVVGDVDPHDFERPGVERIVERALARLSPGSIVVLHDASGIGDFDRSQSVAAAERILAVAAERGLRSVTVSELLRLPGARGDAGWANASGAHPADRPERAPSAAS
jgi:peptidoglycan/xylan/chitin deacetylase (PgdA/CDA1 family)